MTGIAVRNEGVFDEYDEDEMLMVMSLAEYWKIINRLKGLDDRMNTMKKFSTLELSTWKDLYLISVDLLEYF